jgi:hypothetical protein
MKARWSLNLPSGLTANDQHSGFRILYPGSDRRTGKGILSVTLPGSDVLTLSELAVSFPSHHLLRTSITQVGPERIPSTPRPDLTVIMSWLLLSARVSQSACGCHEAAVAADDLIDESSGAIGSGMHNVAGVQRCSDSDAAVGRHVLSGGGFLLMAEVIFTLVLERFLAMSLVVAAKVFAAFTGRLEFSDLLLMRSFRRGVVGGACSGIRSSGGFHGCSPFMVCTS